MTQTLAEALKEEVARLLAPLKELCTPARMASFVQALGSEFDEVVEVALDLDELVDALDLLIGAINSEAAEEQILERSLDVILKLKDLIPKAEVTFTGFALDAQRAGELAELLIRRLLDYLVYQNLWLYHRPIFALCHLLGFAETVETETGHMVETIQWHRFGYLFASPIDLLNEVYAWEIAFDGRELLSRLEFALQVLGISGGIYRQSDSLRAALDRPAWDDKEMRIPLFSHSEYGSYSEIDLNLSPLPATADLRPGLLLYPYLSGAVEINQDLGGNWSFALKGKGDLRAGLGLELRPPADLSIHSSLLTDPLASMEVGLELSVTNKHPAGGLTYLFGSEDGSSFGYMQIGFGLSLALVGSDYHIAGEMTAQGLTLVVDAGDGDGFIQKILSGIVLKSVTDLTIGASNKDGFYFRGSGALEIEIPVHQSLGPVKLEKVLVGIGIEDRITVILAVSLGVELGPIVGSVDRIGVQLPLAIRDRCDGNLGPLNLDGVKFLPPTGAGLALEGGIIFGGGYLEFDDLNARYAGILALSLADFAITAIGLITTKMPDGSTDFSMLISIGIEFDPPIQLSMGFTLSGVGGLIGINRAMVIEELQKRFRSGAVNDILFPDPETVIPRADTIIENMRAVFPPARGSFVIGPMVKIGYGTPNVIQADIGIMLVLPDMSDYVIMGKLKVAFPTPEEETIKVNVQLLGTLSLEKKEFTFQSSIYDSEILKITLWGDVAALLRWSDPPEFTLAMGGFHPKFTPPPPEIIFGGLRRLGLSVTWGDQIFLLCQSYLALTPNSLQFGAGVQIIVNFGDLHANGSFTFDALFYFRPFSFEITAEATVNITIGGASLIDADIDLFLSGPKPWHARGSATVRLLFLDVSGNFDITWGQPGVPSISLVDPLEQVLAELNDSRNWSTRLPHPRSMVESLQPIEAGEAGSLVVHPYGSLEVVQKLPLGVRLDKIGNSPVVNHDQFEITGIRLGSRPEDAQYPVREYRNLGTYKHLSDSAKLSKPSFEKADVGAGFCGDPIALGGRPEIVSQNYESVYLCRTELSETAEADGVLSPDLARFLLAGGSASKSEQWTGGSRKFTKNGQAPLASVNELRYAIADIAGFTRAVDLDQQVRDPCSLWHVEQVLEAHVKDKPEDAGKYIVLAEYELEGVA